MGAGLRNTRITIQYISTWTTDTVGERTLVWKDLDTVWAERKDLTMSELFRAAQMVVNIMTRFNICYRDDITETMRIICNAQYYNIYALADPDNKKRELHILGYKI